MGAASLSALCLSLSWKILIMRQLLRSRKKTSRDQSRAGHQPRYTLIEWIQGQTAAIPIEHQIWISMRCYLMTKQWKMPHNMLFWTCNSLSLLETSLKMIETRLQCLFRRWTQTLHLPPNKLNFKRLLATCTKQTTQGCLITYQTWLMSPVPRKMMARQS